MRELERLDRHHTGAPLPGGPSASPHRLAVVGAGRLGTALAEALAAAGHAVDGPLGRGTTAEHAGVVILAVPDNQIASAARLVAPGRLVGHCSGATTLEPLAPHEAFSLHPLMTVTAEGARFAGAAAAVAGTTERARCTAADLATSLGMSPVEVADEHRAAYHAAASMASNFLITLEAAAERLARTAGVEREHLVPLVRASVENWASLGPERALTGPVARGDDETVARQRAEVAERAPDLLPLFDELVEATKRVRAHPPVPA
jgi:predicted short-subunit dehydrogenase-like oxidoreductase (DUF2520 family)